MEVCASVFVPVSLFILLVNSFTGYGSLLSSSLPMSPTVIGCAVLQPSVNYAHCCCCPHQLFYCLFFFVLFCAGCVVFRCVCAMCMCYRFVLICLVEATHAQNFYHSLQEWSSGSSEHIAKNWKNNNRKQKKTERYTPKTKVTHSYTVHCIHIVNVTHTCILRLYMTSVPETSHPHSG